MTDGTGGANAPRRSVTYAGTYEQPYPRNALIVAALRAAGYDVREIHVPVWERVSDKSARFSGPRALVKLGGALLRAYVHLLPRVMRALPQSDALVIGYIGQPDMLVLAPLAKLLGVPVIFNPLVTLTETLVDDRALVPHGSLAARLIAVIDALALRLANVVLVDTVESAWFSVTRFSVDPGRVVVVPVGADERLFYPGVAELRPNHAPLGPAGAPLRVLFYGKMIPLHGVATVVRAAKLLEPEGVQFRVIGSGQESPAVSRLAKDLAVANVDFTDWVPVEQLPSEIRRADVVLGIFGTGDKAGRVVPNKVYQAMACGAAIVTRNSPAARALLTDGESALLVPPGDPVALADAVRSLRDPQVRVRLGEGARRAFERSAGLSVLAKRVAEAIDLAQSATHGRGCVAEPAPDGR